MPDKEEDLVREVAEEAEEEKEQEDQEEIKSNNGFPLPT